MGVHRNRDALPEIAERTVTAAPHVAAVSQRPLQFSEYA
jgi:hypothetical protein